MKPRPFATRSAAQSLGQRTLGGLNTDFGVVGPDKEGKFYLIAWLRDDQAWMAVDLHYRGIITYPVAAKQVAIKD